MEQGKVGITDEMVDAGAEALDDLLTMLGVDPSERPEHGGPSTAEVLAAAVARAAAPFIAAAELERLAVEMDSRPRWATVTAEDVLARVSQLRGEK
jgi:hypothetical protein